MNRRIITLILALAAVCGGVMAQPKVSGRVPTREKRGYDQQIVIDTANVRVLYALNAKDIKASVSRSTAANSSTCPTRKLSSGRRRQGTQAMCRRAFGLAAGQSFTNTGAS